VNLDFDRVPQLILGITLTGIAITGFYFGPRPALGFAIGAVASYLNFRGWRGVIDRLAQAATGQGRAPGFGSALLILLRLVIVAGGAFVILRHSKESLIALLMGLFVSFAAVVLEVLIATLYARN
jgi:asparagine N-glycosylation enzyme membrane subunit Stt3